MKGSLLLVATFLIAGCSWQEDSPEEMLKSARAVDAAWSNAFSSANIDSLMRLYWKSPELKSYPIDRMELRGWDEVKKSYEEAFASMPGATGEIIEADYTVAGDVVIGTGTWKVSVPTGLGPVMEIFGRFSDVKAKKNDRWVIVLEHASVPVPGPRTRM